MAVVYATYSDFTQVYSLKNVGEVDVNSYWLIHGALRVNERLSSRYTTPFSSNNETAKDLSIHYAALGILKRTRNQTDSIELENYLNQRISDILSGGSDMISSDGTIVSPGDNGMNTVYSSHESYNPVFDMRPSIDQRVDPNELDYLYDRDRDI